MISWPEHAVTWTATSAASGPLLGAEERASLNSDPGSDAELPEAGPPDEFDEYALVLLYRGVNPPDLDDEDSDRLQRQHLGHLQAMHHRGALVLSGPFSDQPDETLRGLCVYRVGLEDARRMAESDPAVRRGRLRIVAFKWYTRKGALHAEAQ